MRLDKVKNMVILLKILREKKEGISPRQIQFTNYTFDGVLSLLKRWKEQGNKDSILYYRSLSFKFIDDLNLI